jgi:hypothetical protein
MAHDVRADVAPVGDGERGNSLRVLLPGPLVVECDGVVVHVAGSHRRRLLALLASRPSLAVSVWMSLAGHWQQRNVRDASGE